ncbi:hypothetical protein QEN19_001804 [Hanseniaspora menglaensis]
MKSIQIRDCDLIIEDKPISPPYPIRIAYQEVKLGFGRGSADLDCPTANIDIPQDNEELKSILPTGVYFGRCKLRPNSKNTKECSEKRVNNSIVSVNKGVFLKKDEIDASLPCVLSIGYNITYEKEGLSERSLEVHVLKNFDNSFYGAEMQLTILGYMRPELKFNSLHELMEGIKIDKQVASEVLLWDSYQII